MRLDGNLTARKHDTLSEMHWFGKFRGPEFDAVSFELPTVTATKLRDSKARTIWTVLAQPLSEEDRAAVEAAQQSDANAILLLMFDTPGLSLMDMARALRWANTKGNPDKRRAQKAVVGMRGLKLVEMNAASKRFVITPKGRTHAVAIRKQELPQGAEEEVAESNFLPRSEC